MEDITDADYKQTKRVWENFGIQTKDSIIIYTWKVIHYY